MAVERLQAISRPLTEEVKSKVHSMLAGAHKPKVVESTVLGQRHVFESTSKLRSEKTFIQIIRYCAILKI